MKYSLSRIVLFAFFPCILAACASDPLNKTDLASNDCHAQERPTGSNIIRRSDCGKKSNSGDSAEARRVAEALREEAQREMERVIRTENN